MVRVPATIPVTDLRQDAAAALKREGHLLRLLAKGDREIAVGKGYGLEAVLADADELLSID